jgi:integrase
MIMTRISAVTEPAYEAIVIQAQQVIAQHRHSKSALEQTTILFYRTNFVRLMRQNEEVLNAVNNRMMTPEQADLAQRPAAKATHYINRRSYNFGLCETIEELLAALEDCAGDSRTGEAREILRRLSNYLDALARVPCDSNRQHLHQGHRSSYEPHPAKPPRPKAGGKGDLGRLPADWRDRVWHAQSPASVYRDGLAVLWATGARPEEIRRSVTLQGLDDEICIRIEGIKTHGGRYGQPWREIWIAADDHPAACHLAELLARDIHEVRVPCAKSFSATLGALWDRIRGRRGVRVSAYSWRHQYAADLKRGGFDSGEIAMALGHASDVTQRHYGAALQSKGTGGVRITQVRAARDVAATAPGRIAALRDRGSPRPGDQDGA